MSKSSMADFNNLWMSYEILMRIPNHFRTKQKRSGNNNKFELTGLPIVVNCHIIDGGGFTQYYCNKNQNNNQKKKRKKKKWFTGQMIQLFVVFVVVDVAVITAS